jgi:hypothetical protein
LLEVVRFQEVVVHASDPIERVFACPGKRPYAHDGTSELSVTRNVPNLTTRRARDRKGRRPEQ